jgi:hypothetical protein
MTRFASSRFPAKRAPAGPEDDSSIVPECNKPSAPMLHWEFHNIADSGRDSLLFETPPGGDRTQSKLMRVQRGAHRPCSGRATLIFLFETKCFEVSAVCRWLVFADPIPLRCQCWSCWSGAEDDTVANHCRGRVDKRQFNGAESSCAPSLRLDK